mgnify:CR=1 FL=1
MAEPIALNILNRQHWEQAGDSERLGCVSCLDRDTCGSIRPLANVFSCRDYCCRSPGTCTRVCPEQPEAFVGRFQEVRGWELDNIPRAVVGRSPELSVSIPIIFHKSRRGDVLRTQSVAIPLKLVVNRNATRVNYASKGSMLRDLCVSSRAKLVLDCIGRDVLIENFWSERRASGLVKAIKRLHPSWVIAPNYSIFTDVPRWDNLYSMKRIAVVWSEFMAAGLPTALTLNARTERDWARWTEFVLARPEVQAVALELGTGGRYANRRAFMLPRLRSLGIAADRRLRLFLRGGRSYIPQLQDAFASVHLLDTNPFMKAVHRQRVVENSGRISSRPSFTLVEQPIEHLLQDNVIASSR